MPPMPMTRRTTRAALVGLAALLGVMAPALGHTQPSRVRIGLVAVMPSPVFRDALRQGLRDRGWVEGANLVLEERYPEGGRLDRTAGVVEELVRLPVDLLVTSGFSATSAAQRATRSIPIVFSTSDPVERGFVASLARPGGNLTGVAGLSTETSVKRLEALRSALPQVKRVGILYTGSAGQPSFLQAVERAAKSLSVQLVPVKIEHADDYDRAAAIFTEQKVQAFVPMPAPSFVAQKERLLGFAARLRLPAVFEERSFVEAGGLMSYGADRRDTIRRMAAQVDRILRGARPAETPVEQVTKIELVLNEKAARALGLTFSRPLLARADEVIR